MVNNQFILDKPLTVSKSVCHKKCPADSGGHFIYYKFCCISENVSMLVDMLVGGNKEKLTFDEMTHFRFSDLKSQNRLNTWIYLHDNIKNKKIGKTFFQHF